jgi:hypothetical protein
MASYIIPSASNQIVGTGINTPPVDLVNTMNALTPNEILPVVADQWSQPSEALSWLTREGPFFRRTPQLIYGLAVSEDPAGGAYQGAQLLQPAVVDNITPAMQVWCPYRQSCAIDMVDVILNHGVEGAVDLVLEKLMIMNSSMLQKLSRALYGVAPQNTSVDLTNIDAWYGQSNNVVAGINRATSANSYWLPQTALNVGGALTAGGTNGLNTGYQNIVNAFDRPDTILMEPFSYNDLIGPYFTTSLTRWNDKFVDEEVVNIGIRNRICFNTCLIIEDRNIPTTGSNFPKAYMFTSRYFKLAFHPDDYFTMDPWIQPSGQRVISTTLYCIAQTVCFKPSTGIAFTNLAH